MTVRLHVQDQSQVVVPLRFDARAITGRPALDAPELDDRGFVMPRPSGFVTTDVRGPMVGISAGDTVRIKVVREDLDASAPLFATVAASADPQVEIVEPAGGGPLPADGIFKVRGIADTSTGQAIEVRLGSATGPVLAELEPHVFDVRTLLVTAHIVTIHTASSAAAGNGTQPITEGEVRDVFRHVRAIWRPAGVDVSLAATIQTHVVLNATHDDACMLQNTAHPVNSGRQITQRGWTAGRCNVYFVAFTDGLWGIGVNFEALTMAQFVKPAVVIAAWGDNGVYRTDFNNHDSWIQSLGNDAAHELGHFLTLTHARAVSVDATLPRGPEDTYARRQLMHPMNPLQPGGAARTADVGYGRNGPGAHRGCLLTLKDYTRYVNDGEVNQARARLNHANLYRDV